MMYNAEKIGKIILTERTKRQLSQVELGKKLNITGKQISNYEKAKLIPPIETLLSMCDFFHCELGYLLGESDYSEGTKLETAMIENTGLSSDALNNIRKITGTDKHCLNFGYESEHYQFILNSLFSSPQFINCIECLYDLDVIIFEYKNAFREIEEKIGKERLDEAVELYRSRTDFIHNPSTSELTSEQTEVLNLIDSAIDKQHSLSYSEKIARYELHESFELLIESLYPRKKY